MTTTDKPVSKKIHDPHWITTMAEHLRGKVDDRLNRADLVVASHEICQRIADEGQREITLQDVVSAAQEYLEVLSDTDVEEINQIALRQSAEILNKPQIIESLDAEEEAKEALQEAQDKFDNVRAEREQAAREVQDLTRQKQQIETRLGRLNIDTVADKKTHLATIHRLLGTESSLTTPYDQTTLQNAFYQLGNLPTLEAVLPGLKKELTAELSKIEKRLAELTAGK